jgi:predicted hydrocarbon binding protein
MGPVLYEAGKKVAFYFAQDAREWLRYQPGYRALAKAENAEEANLSGEIKAIQVVYKSNRVGLLSVVECVKDKLIVVEVHECSDCFDIGNIGKPICYSIGGNIAGSLEIALDRELGFVETKCIAKGDTTCEFRFSIRKKD